ncbi:hypothetical protein [Pseudoalteromonas luteoviolacea]|uniref:RNA polymerase sigma factor 70 region 4 type 2 domain-containing protein n=1 Tax=Pseudoalteromonas luteoviolacea NCIMB 1942 TaxID=1365253 RepID=A0A167AQH9_9GAMM|nr:hypothetical protein [Pseudoalteromonas luteoviolacea]KZN45682.1 hypothetical protein N482_14130 [Pseudoalteromonas luteoviolacea NCIMB 1942]KZX00432.1 hypothetical protein JL49_11070 [Pseudoalteromonas luteoviolacea]
MITTQITIKHIRNALRRWGKFWRQRELGKGFSRQAVTEQAGGGRSNYFSSDMMSVPEEIELIGQLIAKLRPECIRAIRAKYLLDMDLTQAAKMLGFDTKRSAEFWLIKAERALMLELSY